jgi:hypothetical protein
MLGKNQRKTPSSESMPPGKKPKASGRERSFSMYYRCSWTYLENTPVSAAPSARSVAGAASLPSLPPGGFPAINETANAVAGNAAFQDNIKKESVSKNGDLHTWLAVRWQAPDGRRQRREGGVSSIIS